MTAANGIINAHAITMSTNPRRIFNVCCWNIAAISAALALGKGGGRKFASGQNPAKKMSKKTTPLHAHRSSFLIVLAPF